MLREVSAKRLIDSCGVTENLGNIGREEPNVRATHVPVVILTANAPRCGGLIPDFIVTIIMLIHKVFVRHSSPYEEK